MLHLRIPSLATADVARKGMFAGREAGPADTLPEVDAAAEPATDAATT